MGRSPVTPIIDPPPRWCYKLLLCAGGTRPAVEAACKRRKFSDAAKSALLHLCLAVEARSEKITRGDP